MKYVVDVLENTLNREEANEYYAKSVVEMNEIERESYIKNEMKYVSFFEDLFEKNDKEVIIKINNFCNSDINEFFEQEKLDFLDELKKINIEDIMLKNDIIIEHFKDIICLIKLSYRDFTAGANKLELKYKNIGVEISSNSDYIYILNDLSNLKIEISKIARKNSLFLKEISTMQNNFD